MLEHGLTNNLSLAAFTAQLDGFLPQQCVWSGSSFLSTVPASSLMSFVLSVLAIQSQDFDSFPLPCSWVSLPGCEQQRGKGASANSLSMEVVLHRSFCPGPDEFVI